MPVLPKSKHEHFAQLVAKGVSVTKAYVSAGYSGKGAAASASRMLTNASICGRIAELRETLAAGTIALEIGNRNARVTALQSRWNRMRQVIDERAASPEFGDVPGGSTGLLCKTYVGKDADQPVYKLDTGLLAELRAHEQQAAQELGQWKTVVESKTVTFNQTTITLGLLLTDAELDVIEKRAIDAEKKRGQVQQ
jgi:HAMP domain-containing protein